MGVHEQDDEKAGLGGGFGPPFFGQFHGVGIPLNALKAIESLGAKPRDLVT